MTVFGALTVITLQQQRRDARRRARQAQRESELSVRYEQGWVRAQADLMVRLRAGTVTVESAVQELHTHPWRNSRRVYDAGYYAGLYDLTVALHEGRITEKAAALNLGMIAPGEN